MAERRHRRTTAELPSAGRFAFLESIKIAQPAFAASKCSRSARCCPTGNHRNRQRDLAASPSTEGRRHPRHRRARLAVVYAPLARTPSSTHRGAGGGGASTGAPGRSARLPRRITPSDATCRPVRGLRCHVVVPPAGARSRTWPPRAASRDGPRVVHAAPPRPGHRLSRLASALRWRRRVRRRRGAAGRRRDGRLRGTQNARALPSMGR